MRNAAKHKVRKVRFKGVLRTRIADISLIREFD